MLRGATGGAYRLVAAPGSCPKYPESYAARVLARGVFSPSDLEAACTQLEERLREWGLPPAAARGWTSSAAPHVLDEGRWELELDRDLGLVTFEVWVVDRRVFGIDDFVGPGAI